MKSVFYMINFYNLFLVVNFFNLIIIKFISIFSTIKIKYSDYFSSDIVAQKMISVWNVKKKFNWIWINNLLFLAVPSEMNILKRERFNNWYNLRTYYTAFLLVDLPMQVSISIPTSLFSDISFCFDKWAMQ